MIPTVIPLLLISRIICVINKQNCHTCKTDTEIIFGKSEVYCMGIKQKTISTKSGLL